MHAPRRHSMLVSNQIAKPRLSEQRLAADVAAFRKAGGEIERLGHTPLRHKQRGPSAGDAQATVATANTPRDTPD
ncbi:hypothetical protein [Xanthomonas maliensis]|uniref:hypothetical protein n=1 Tax=Xanthomonas maliensis TaxID=1321368 RepID=UPI0004CED35F|nr:hypothetical protein [Xanthomonas maliensis]KAB7771526.1 hypothetical protein CKY51_02705 [Xanthomonas maliensis]